jgi:anti-sigma regulatory factor (Ser/Thr protein kinase)
VFGEIVALLWEAGEVTAVLELERCWNALGAVVDFSLLCGVAEHTARRPGYAPALARWCGLHSGVDGLDRIAGPAGGWFGDTATATFEADAKAPRDARRFVAGILARWRVDVPIDETMCVVSELAANAVLHARMPFSLRLTYRPGVVRIEVQDGASAMPAPRAAVPETVSGGRGLRIVEALASGWGFSPLDEGGKVVWAELELGNDERLSTGGRATD